MVNRSFNDPPGRNPNVADYYKYLILAGSEYY